VLGCAVDDVINFKGTVKYKKTKNSKSILYQKKKMKIILLMNLIAGISTFCDKYSFKQDQLKLITTLVNTAMMGNYTETVNNKIVKGIFGQGQKFDLTGFFTGTQNNVNGGKTANVNGKAQSVNFLDGGGVEALKLGKASNLAGYV
jgi:hypothetical protein